MRRRLWGVALLSVALLGGSAQRLEATHSADDRPPAERILWDNFRDGFTVGAADSKWFHFAAGPYVGDDGLVTTSSKGLRVRASGTNPTSGEPAFVRSLGQEGSPSNPLGLPGGLDHVKWLAYMNHFSSQGYPGFDTRSGQQLSCESWISAESYGVENHPFGAAVLDSQDDLRLGSAAMNSIDFETMMVFDFFLTNKRIYALYERLPFAREQLGNYASFTYQIPIRERNPDDFHHLKISYDKDAGVVRWLIDEEEVFRVDQIGHRIDRQFMTLDHDGEEQAVVLRQLSCGMGMFTLLDAARPSGQGLVKLSAAPGFYLDPLTGSGSASFVDTDSLDASRLFGQGAELRVKRYVVSYSPAP